MTIYPTSEKTATSYVPKIVRGVVILGGLAGLGTQVYNMVHRSERDFTDWTIVSSCVLSVATTVFGEIWDQQHPTTGYQPLREGRVQNEHDIEKLSPEVDQRTLSIDSENHALEAPVENQIIENGDKKELEELRATLNETQATLQKASLQISELQSQKASLEAKLQSNMDLSTSYLEQRSTFEQKCVKLERELKKAQKELQETNEDHDGLTADLTQKIVLLDDQLLTLQQQFQELLSADGNNSPKFKQFAHALANAKALSSSASASASSPVSPMKRTSSFVDPKPKSE